MPTFLHWFLGMGHGKGLVAWLSGNLDCLWRLTTTPTLANASVSRCVASRREEKRDEAQCEDNKGFPPLSFQ